MRDFTGNQRRGTKTGIKSSGTNICPGSEANMRSFANCLAVIVEADTSSRGDMIFSSSPLGNCRAVTAGSVRSVMCSLGLMIRVSVLSV